MLEQQRIEYLQAMGIQLWMPRQALDYAAEPSWLAESGEANTSSEMATGMSFQAGHAADLLADIGSSNTKANVQYATNTSVETASSRSPENPEQTISNRPADTRNPVAIAEPDVTEAAVVDLTVPNFELHFALWPCGILWVSSKPFTQADHTFQTAVSYFLLGSGVPQASYSQFKWPYIEGSSEDQSMAVALRALTAQWEFMSGQGARGWISMDDSSLEWLTKVTAKPLFSVSSTNALYCSAEKKQLWQVLHNLSLTSVS
jgi:hypothetical protein